MDTKYLFYITLVISIIVQIITGIIEIGAFFCKSSPHLFFNKTIADNRIGSSDY